MEQASDREWKVEADAAASNRSRLCSMGHATWSQLGVERCSATPKAGVVFEGVHLRACRYGRRLSTRVRCDPPRDGGNEIGTRANSDALQQLSDRLDTLEVVHKR